MLAMVERLGTFGISVLMATHLLDDVQQVCDHVLMIDAGKLVVSGPTDALLERTGMVTIDVGGHDAAELLARELVSLDLRAEVVDAAVEMEVDADEDLDRARDTVAHLGLPLYRLATRLTSLDDVFLERAAHR
jgi:ABC-2 type transport system ATP-binding protein